MSEIRIADSNLVGKPEGKRLVKPNVDERFFFVLPV
jgi:hypothetical protein